MNLVKRILSGNPVYQALAHAYEERMLIQKQAPRPEQFARYGRNVHIDRRVYISHPGRVAIGDWTTIQNQTVIHSVGGVHIGRYVGIGYRAMILTFQHRYRNAKSIPFDEGLFLHPVVIRDFGWIGWGSMLLPGVEVGEGAIVGMGSVVTENVPPLAIVLGNPAKVIGYRSAEHFAQCKAEGRMIPHRILEQIGQFEEIIPLMVKKKYARELSELGMIAASDTPAAAPAAAPAPEPRGNE